MGELNTTATIHTERQAEAKNSTPNHGTLKAEGKEYQVFAFSDTESVTKGVSEFLGELHEKPETLETILSGRIFTEISEETIEIETEIMQLDKALHQLDEKGRPTKQKQVTVEPQKKSEAKPLENPKSSSSKVVYSSLFSLAHSFNKGLTQARAQKPVAKETQKQEESKLKQPMALSSSLSMERNSSITENKYDQQREEGKGSGKEKEDKEQKEKQKRKEPFKIKASRSTKAQRISSSEGGRGSLGSVENIFIRFMALMARILGQSEAEAHALYLRIKERTDNIDLLTLLVSKINSEKGEVDWENNEEMKKLVDRARELGVDIPEGKYKWSEDEKKLLKENIQMRKDSMEKITQLERTDMQRYLQEASQCHQARSNVLKLLKEVMDTIIHNMRP